MTDLLTFFYLIAVPQMFEGIETKAVDGRLAAPKKVEMVAVDVELEEELVGVHTHLFFHS